MPFKSEAQRRYLWANEPEIARDWTDTYGSKIHAANGGIMRLPFAEGDIVDEFGNTYENRDDRYKDFSEVQFDERFGGEGIGGIEGIEGIGERLTSGIDTLKDKVIGGKDWLMSALGTALDAPGIGLVMRGLQGPQLTQAQKDMNQQFFQTGNMGRPVGIGTQQNPFQMTSGPFTGMNAPGMSAFGSATSQEMAQKWLEKYKDTAPQTKVETMLDLASVPSGNPIGGVDHIAAGSGNNMGSANTGAYSSAGTTGAKEGYSYGLNRGGIVDLWRR